MNGTIRRERSEERGGPPGPVEADGRGERTGSCGDTVSLELFADGDRIEKVRFQIHGCLHTLACARALADLVQGGTAEAAWRLNPEDVVARVEELPEEKHHCAELGVGALYAALADLQANRRRPWQRLYRTGRRRPGS